MSADWFFDDPPNIAVITTRQILELGYPILHVTHDAARMVAGKYYAVQQTTHQMLGLSDLAKLSRLIQV